MHIKFSLFLLLFCVSSLFSQSETGAVKYLNAPSKGTITVAADGHGKKKTIAFENATQTAFRQLLTRGIPGSFQYKPLLGDHPTKVMADHEAFFSTFFSSAGYEPFIVSRRAGSFSRRAKKTNPNLIVSLEINVSGLRDYLTEIGVLRKFGF